MLNKHGGLEGYGIFLHFSVLQQRSQEAVILLSECWRAKCCCKNFRVAEELKQQFISKFGVWDDRWY